MEPNSQEKKSSLQQIRLEAREKIIGYVLAGFGLVAALAWNEAIKSFIDTFFHFSNGSLIAKFVYAIILTLVIVIISMYLSKLIKKENE